MLNVTVTYVPVNCDDRSGVPIIDVKVTAEAIPQAVPDPDLGPDFPHGLVRIDTSDLASFWTDASVGYTVFPDSGGLLKTISSHPVNQAGTIVGNFLTGVVKIVTAAAVPGPVALGKGQCGSIFAKNGELEAIAAIKKRMPGEQKSKAEDDAQRIVTLRDSMTVTVKKIVDTATSVPDGQGIVATISPDLDEVVAHRWKTLKGDADPRHQVYLVLDFDKANLLAPYSCPADKPKCSRHASVMDGKALFRQAAYVPVQFHLAQIDPAGGVVRNAGLVVFGKDELGPPKIVSFGQYGIPRTLPLKIGAFRDTNWTLEFSQAGEITTSTFGNKASGVGISSAFAGAASAASDLNGIGAKAAAAVDTDTLRLQTENAKLKAQTDNYDLKAKLELQNAGKPDE